MKQATHSQHKGYDDTKKGGTGQRTVSHNKPTPPNHLSDTPTLPADLAEIAELWPALPDHVKTGLVAMAKAAAGKADA